MRNSRSTCLLPTITLGSSSLSNVCARLLSRLYIKPIAEQPNNNPPLIKYKPFGLARFAMDHYFTKAGFLTEFVRVRRCAPQTTASTVFTTLTFRHKYTTGCLLINTNSMEYTRPVLPNL